MNDIQLPWSFFNIHGLEFNGQISFLKAGLYYADHITAVSPTYAREITEPQFAYGMEGLLQQRHREGRLSGVLNGVDEKIWSPETDLLLASRYTRDTLEDKAENKRQLQIAMGLKVDDKVPLFAVVSRLTSQKGLDLVLEALPGSSGAGRATGATRRGRSGAAGRFPLRRQRNTPARWAFRLAITKHFSHRIMGGADVILVPSRFEPCGLTQLYGLKYGTLPLVRRTGGLADTVSDCSLENLADGVASGFVFEDSNAWSLLRAIRRAFVLWSRPSLWRFVQRQAMAMDFSWQVAAKSYRELYYRLK
ncbi:glycogen synthase [Escherichia coli]|uniref:starch synthase n=1 Tax=Escherichia coli TaxID=562 RepID=A0A376LDR0_ECOLX|nr:glycogen synthase [Escherichia coli]